MPALPEMVNPIVAALNAVYVKRREAEKRRGYLGASVIGDACDKRLWMEFRWAGKPEDFEGRILRLFNTGHRAEDRMIADLRDAGMTVRAVDPDTGEQYEVGFARGHGGGHGDGEVEGVPGAVVVVHLLEMKTHNDKSFEQLKKFGVKISHPKHYAQMQVYMHLRHLKRALYLALNKNTDHYHPERVEYDAQAALALMSRAEHIVGLHVAPQRISEDPTSFACRFCPKWDVCHGANPAERNCRTCLHSTPEPGGVWRCEMHNRVLSREDQEAGCAQHLYLPSLVPGEQIDAAPDLSSVTYKMRDGREWTDGNKPAGPLVVPVPGEAT